jgi:hypothetical protein
MGCEEQEICQQFGEIKSKVREKIKRLRAEIQQQEEEHQIIINHVANLKH